MEKLQQLGDRHVVLVTAPCPGHCIPFAQLARYLLSRGVRVSCFSSGMNLPSVEQKLEESFRGERIVFQPLISAAEFVSLEDDHLKYLHALSDGEMTARFETALEALHPPPQCIISDGFTGWTQDVADKRGIARHLLCTFPSNALLLIFACNPWLPAPVGAPVHPPGTWDDKKKSTEPLWDMLVRNVKRMPDASLIIVNTFEALEERLLGIVRKGLLGKPGVRTESILTIGPMTRRALEEVAIVPTEKRNSSCAEEEEEEWKPWLDAQEQSSVLYVSFGSVSAVSEVQIHELAYGLEHSGRPFLWVYRPPKAPQVQALEANGDALLDGLPAGFVERVSGRGKLMFGWAPQEAILAHASVGGFLTHCGWNSTLEALWAGKPMCLWPIAADQKLTARYLALELRIAVMVAHGEHGVVTRSEVMRAVSVLMDDKEMRRRFQTMHQLSRSSLGEGSASRSNLQILVTTLMESLQLQQMVARMDTLQLQQMVARMDTLQLQHLQFRSLQYRFMAGSHQDPAALAFAFLEEVTERTHACGSSAICEWAINELGTSVVFSSKCRGLTPIDEKRKKLSYRTKSTCKSYYLRCLYPKKASRPTSWLKSFPSWLLNPSVKRASGRLNRKLKKLLLKKLEIK